MHIPVGYAVGPLLQVVIGAQQFELRLRARPAPFRCLLQVVERVIPALCAADARAAQDGHECGGFRASFPRRQREKLRTAPGIKRVFFATQELRAETGHRGHVPASCCQFDPLQERRRHTGCLVKAVIWACCHWRPVELVAGARGPQNFVLVAKSGTPLMMGAIAYVILFIPVVVLGRFLETRFAWRRV